MARERADWKGFTAVTVACTGSSLFYGAILSSRVRNASLWIFDHNSTGNAVASKIKMKLFNGAVTGTTSVVFPVPMQMDLGVVASLNSGSFGTILFSGRS